MNLVATHHNCTSPMDYISHHALHPHIPLHQSHSCHHSLINPDCLTTPAPHSHTHIKAAHIHSPIAKSCFAPADILSVAPVFWFPVFTWTAYLLWPFAACPFDPACPVDIFSVCCLPRPLNCPCCWFCLAFIIPVTAFDPCLFDILSEIKLLLDLTSLPSHYNCSINDGWLSWPRWSKTGPSHETTTSMFHRWDKILKLECSVFFSPNITASHVKPIHSIWFHPSIKHFFQYSSG